MDFPDRSSPPAVVNSPSPAAVETPPPTPVNTPTPETANPMPPNSLPTPSRIGGFSVAFRPTPLARSLNAPLPLARYRSLGQALNSSLRLLATQAGRAALGRPGLTVVDEWTTRPPLGPNRHINGANVFKMSQFVDELLTRIANECPYIVLGHTLDRHTLAYFHKAFPTVWDPIYPHFEAKTQHAMAMMEMDDALRGRARGTNEYYLLYQDLQRYTFESMCAITRQLGHMFVSYLALMQTSIWGEGSTLAGVPAQYLAGQPEGNDGLDIPRDQAGAWLIEALFGGEVVHFRPQSRYHETVKPAKAYIFDQDGRYSLINVFELTERPEEFVGRSSPTLLLQGPHEMGLILPTIEAITPDRVFSAPYQTPQDVQTEVRERLCWMPRVDFTFH
ncbi:hypothetical protein B0T19DRAFT_456815 [Cercophora scortea]|uniref:Uncharacterized protein n=1 Tax=Cercophora scortea TaxID=314031 RepID=A0AAE0IW79_9PEZI|nr:hypothetical protein B0T19DRAFT_456815 [Cercophora scortea]